ncbi:malectin domain-containing carbohydrate-binding protein [Lunatibacter salilacus]|uniref:malectin domain-containing carbohydrate-binding protein n=1 Tax=Lunatibacter salilacus TaxID=2483804 RepID=UPI00131ECAD2|nr:malectin domain-containing carbohydrate-binding protein [Lunatibacter salilacus]
MKPTLKSTLFLLLLFCLFTSTYGASYYFSSSTGNDSRSNSEAQNMNTPWRSIDKLNSIMRILQPGDVVYFRRGEEFSGTINFNSSGSATNPIKFSAYGSGPAPVITSLIRVQGWRALGNGIYESNQSFNMSEIELMILNGKQQERGRYPNRDQFNGGYLRINSASGNRSVTSSELSGAPNFNGGEVVIRKNQWITDRHPISSHSGNTISFSGDSKYMPSLIYGFFVQNHINTLDRFGEWMYNKSNKKLYVFFGSNSPDNFNVQIPSRDNLFVKGYGASNFQIDNLNFKGANKNAIDIAGGRNVTLLNNKIEFSGISGIYSLSILELKINGNEIDYSSSNGISLRYGAVGAHILNNKITNTALFQGSMQSGDGAGLGIHAIDDNIKIEYNEIINTGYLGIHFGGNSTVVSNNFVDNFCLHKGDGGGIYSYGAVTASKGREQKIVDNIIINGSEGASDGVFSLFLRKISQSHGIFLDDNVSNVIVTNNTIAGMGDTGIKLNNVNNLVVENNTIYNNDKGLAIADSENGGDVRSLTIQKNIVFPKEQYQQSYSFIFNKNSIAQIGNVNQNYFFKPFGDPFHMFVRYRNGSSYVQKTLNLNGWKNGYNKDHTSKEVIRPFEYFKVVNSIGDNLFKNGNFLSNVVGVTCADCQSSWTRGQLSQGSLKVQSPSSSTVLIPLGAVRKNQNYVAKLRARSNKNGTIRVFLRQTGNPWQVASPSTAIELNANNQEISVLLKPYDNVENAALLIVSDESNFEYWLEDLDVRQSNIIETKPEDRILFEYNKSKTEKRITLDGSYVDAKGQSFSGTVAIPPYQSVVLFKTSSDIPKESISPPTISITSPTAATSSLESGQKLSITTAVNANGNNIKEVIFYNGTQIIGRSASSPYNFQWENPPAGDLTLKASVQLQSDLAYDSKIVSTKLSIVGNDGIPDEGTTEKELTDAIYINTGSNSAATYKGNLFDSEFKDRYFIGGNTESNSRSSSEPVMQSQRFGKNFRYEIPVPNGRYQVKTFHNEVYFGHSVPLRGPNLRVFDISIEGKVVKNNLDIAVAFPNGNGELSFNNVEVKDGVLTIQIVATRGDAAISGIAIIPSDTSTPLPPVPPVVSEPSKNTQVVYQINTGSTRDAKYLSSTFESEFRSRFFDTGFFEETSSAHSEPMLQSQRFGKQIGYRVPIENGTYTVKTYHNEVYFGNISGVNGPNLRIFDISLQGLTVKTNMDLFVESKNQALVLTFDNIVVTNGILSLDLSARVGHAAISGFEILAGGSSSNPNNKSNINSKFPANGIYINAGSTSNTSFSGTNFVSDFDKPYFSGGFFEQSNSASSHELLRSQRFANSLSYDVPVPNGLYTVVSYHNEVYFGNGAGRPPKRPGQRVFNIEIEGRRVKSNMDMHLEKNGQPIELIFENISVNDGILNFALNASVGHAAISGLAIFPSVSNFQSSANLRQAGETQPIEGSRNFDVPATGSRIVLYPNPAIDEINIKIGRESEGVTLYIHNSMGQNLLTQEISEETANYGEIKIPLSGFNSGIYFISIHDLNGRFEKEKFIVK